MNNRKNTSAVFPSLTENVRSRGATASIVPALRAVIHGVGQAGAEIASSLPALELVILPAVGLFVLMTI